MNGATPTEHIHTHSYLFLYEIILSYECAQNYRKTNNKTKTTHVQLLQTSSGDVVFVRLALVFFLSVHYSVSAQRDVSVTLASRVLVEW